MKKTALKIIFLLFLTAAAVFLFNDSGSVFADIPLEEKLKGRILLQVEENGEAWYVNPYNLERYYLGRPDDAFILMQVLGTGITNDDLGKIKIANEYFSGADSDSDGIPDAIEKSIGTDFDNSDTDGDDYNDAEELFGDYNPKGEGKIKIDKQLSENLAGRILLQIEKNGEAWYVNPDNLKRYFLGRPGDAFELMRKLGLGISNADLGEIKKYNDYSEKITREQTKAASKNERRYYDKDYNYSFEYCNGFSIKKYEEKPNVVFLSDSLKDFFLEKKSMIMMVFIDNQEIDLDDFKSAASEDAVREVEIKGLNAIEYNEKDENTSAINTIIAASDKKFLKISLSAANDAIDNYRDIYNNLIQSLEINEQ